MPEKKPEDANNLDLYEAVSRNDVQVVASLIPFVKNNIYNSFAEWYVPAIFKTIEPEENKNIDDSITILSLLKKNGADFNNTSHSYKSPLNRLMDIEVKNVATDVSHSCKDFFKLLDFLLENGANPKQTEFKNNPLQIFLDGRFYSTPYLIEEDINNQIYPKNFYDLLIGRFLKYGLDINAKGFRGRNVLHIAAESGYAKAIEALIEHGANVNAIDIAGNTPLHEVAESFTYKDSEYFNSIARALLKARSNVNAINEEGRTPLHCAAGSGKVDMVQILLNAGANFSIADKQGFTPVQLAQQSLKQYKVTASNPPAKREEQYIQQYKKIISILSNQGNLTSGMIQQRQSIVQKGETNERKEYIHPATFSFNKKY